MIERIAVVGARGVPAAPSQLCAFELEAVLGAMLSAPILSGMGDDRQEEGTAFDRVIFVAMNYWQLSRMIE